MSSVRSPVLGAFCTLSASGDAGLVPGGGTSAEQWCCRPGVRELGAHPGRMGFGVIFPDICLLSSCHMMDGLDTITPS